ncbi:MAG: hypothetical protein A2Y38_10345 [Spirochaetes bacterium GWB1_59_5]|nr:MAG: hypothetical protein A2Y38_10345 [Spirochaetes bacterium GWB1_59_5]
MANRIYIIPRRNDLAGANIYLKELKPVAGQKNSIYDGEHQDFYLRYSFDVPGITVTQNGSYLSGSLSTTPLGALVVTNTVVGPNNVRVTPVAVAEFGLEAYLRERVTNAANALMPVAVAARARQYLLARIVAGSVMDATGINLAINQAATDVGGMAATCDLTAGRSFGTVEEVLRLLSGEAYITPGRTIVGDDPAGVFLAQATRAVLVAAATTAVFFASGHFLAADEAGYRAMPTIVQTTALLSSLQMPKGQLWTLNGLAVEILNGGSFAYAAAAVDAWHPRAQTLQGSGVYGNIPVTGSARVLRVYRNDGTCLEPVI